MENRPRLSPHRARLFLVGGVLFVLAIASALVALLRLVSGEGLLLSEAAAVVLAFVGMGVIGSGKFNS